MKVRNGLLWGAVFGVLLLTGCTSAILLGTGAGAGVGSYSYAKGELTADYPEGYENVWSASLTALDKLGIVVNEKDKDSLTGKIKGTRGDGKGGTVKIKNRGKGITRVSARVGTWGDQEASRKIHETIMNFVEN
jgi:hypothetical protein